MPAMWPTCRIQRKQPNSSKRLPPPRYPVSNRWPKENKMNPTQTKPSIVFCHGIWADGSCFNKVIPTLQAEGHQVIAVQYGLDSQAADVAATKRTLGRVSSPAILVGHSYGGAVIAAVAPDAGETVQSQLDKYPTPIFGHIEVAGGRVWMLPEGVKDFAGDLPEQEQKVVWATHFAPDADLFNQKVDGTAWKSKPSWSIVATEDRTVHPDLERFLAKRMGAKTVEAKSSHVVMLSRPQLVIDVIRKAAKAAQGATAT